MCKVHAGVHLQNPLLATLKAQVPLLYIEASWSCVLCYTESLHHHAFHARMADANRAFHANLSYSVCNKNMWKEPSPSLLCWESQPPASF